jgi:two-component system, OmpR family, sensor kinase
MSVGERARRGGRLFWRRSRSLPQGAAVRLSTVSLRVRLLGILLVLLVGAVLSTGWAMQRVLRGFLVAQVDEDLAQIHLRLHRDPRYLESVVSSLQDGQRGNPFSLPSYVLQFSLDDDPTGLRTSLPWGELSRSAVLKQPDHDEATADDGRIHTVRGLVDGSGTFRAVALPFLYENSDGEHPGAILVAQSLDDVDSSVDKVRWAVLWSGCAVLLAGVLLGWLAIRRAFVPLAQVERTAAAIAAGDLSRRVPSRHPRTEVGRLTESLNGMLAQIESAFRDREASEARTRRFAADASHELRTPLAAIRGFAELYRQGAVADHEVPRTIRRIESEAERMGGLVEDLLLLARLDEKRPTRSEPVDLAVLAGDAVHDARGLDPTRRVTLCGPASEGPCPAVVIGDEDRLRQVVANLVGNAIRHTPQGTPIELAVGVVPGQPSGTASSGSPGSPGRAASPGCWEDGAGPVGSVAVLEVRDHGPGIPPDKTARVFERFYRVDTSRSRGQGGGAGLGLSIVVAVVESHGGTVCLRPTPGGGSTFRVVLPCAPDDVLSCGNDRGASG